MRDNLERHIWLAAKNHYNHLITPEFDDICVIKLILTELYAMSYDSKYCNEFWVLRRLVDICHKTPTAISSTSITTILLDVLMNNNIYSDNMNNYTVYQNICKAIRLILSRMANTEVSKIPYELGKPDLKLC